MLTGLWVYQSLLLLGLLVPSFGVYLELLQQRESKEGLTIWSEMAQLVDVEYKYRNFLNGNGNDCLLLGEHTIASHKAKLCCKLRVTFSELMIVLWGNVVYGSNEYNLHTIGVHPLTLSSTLDLVQRVLKWVYLVIHYPKTKMHSEVQPT